MKKLVLLMHVTLDGLVAGPNGEMNWIYADDELFDIAGDRTDEADTALYGRVTFEMMESYWPAAGDQPKASKHDKVHSKWYNDVRKIVVSRTLQGADVANAEIVSENIADEVERIKQQPGKDILLIGSPSVVHALLGKNLIDDYWLFVNPVLLGQGIPLFKNVKSEAKLTLVSSKVLNAGVICVHYSKSSN